MRTHRKTYRTNALFPRANFRTGAGSIFNIAGNYYRFRQLHQGEKADFIALENDWGAIAQDLKKAIKEFTAKKL
jgi:hypothetical protein